MFVSKVTTKHKKTLVNSFYIVGIVFVSKVNEWCLVEFFHQEFRVSNQIMVSQNIALRNVKSFPPAAGF